MAILVAGVSAVSVRAQDATTSSDWSLHAQSTLIYQWHYGFPSPYEGPNSFGADPEGRHTLSVSVFLARNLWEGATLVYTPEGFQGAGLSHTLGLAGYPNGEAIKAGFPNLHYNTSRLYLRQVIGLGGAKEKLDDGPQQTAQEVDVNRITVTVGKVAANDSFDDNAYSHDARSQFCNWALWESGAWDAPGDVLGFTGAVSVEWNTPHTTLRYGLFMEPTVANSAILDSHVRDAHGQMLQYDVRYTAGSLGTGTVRPFVYWNRANMGDYAAAGAMAAPDIAASRRYRDKWGAGVSWDQAIGADGGVFARISWNDGATEDMAFSEIDRSLALGGSWKGAAWHRKDDTVGLAVVESGLSSPHRQYLERGGIGFLLGDGALDYGAEQIVEAYYACRIVDHLTLGPDWQYFEHPAYNRDRGGFSVYAVRAHAEF